MSIPTDLWRTRQIEFFDVLASLNKALAQSSETEESLPLFKILKNHIHPLFPFEIHFFVIPNPETFEFEIALCDPPEALPIAQKALDFTIQENTFAWSLKQNRAVTLRCEPLKKSLVLHAITTQDHKYGMFMGVTRLGGIHEMDFTLPMISAIIQRGAYTLDRQKLSEKIKITKIEAIGLIAGGIAHNFNNVLQSIQGNLALAQLEIEASHPSQPFLQQALQSCHRAGLLSNQLLTFSKGGAPVRTRYSLKQQIESILIDIQKEHSISCVFKSEGDDALIEADHHQIHHAFTQLLHNAAEASVDSSKIEVSLQSHQITPDAITSLSPGSYWKIEIKDHGCGIPEESLSKCLEPYFTTKPNHTGLGLTTALSILKNHGGNLEIYSVVEKGTSLQIHLPSAKTVYPPIETQHTKANKNSSNIRVLHMDDEESLRNLLRTVLQKQGFEVTSTIDGNATLEAYQKSIQDHQKFDWVILDLMIPGGMGGAETIQRLREIDPHVKAMVCSGYSNDPIMANPLEYGFQAVLKKPFSFQELFDQLKH